MPYALPDAMLLPRRNAYNHGVMISHPATSNLPWNTLHSISRGITRSYSSHDQVHGVPPLRVPPLVVMGPALAEGSPRASNLEARGTQADGPHPVKRLLLVPPRRLQRVLLDGAPDIRRQQDELLETYLR